MIKCRVADPHNFYAAPAPAKHFYAAPAAPALALLNSKAKKFFNKLKFKHILKLVCAFYSIRLKLLEI
jgi:hypothetical protein